VNTETTKAMQEALEAAVTRMNNGSGAPSALSPDTMGALMAVLPKLLQNDGSGEEMLEKLDALRKEDLTPLRGQLRMMRKQTQRMLKSQKRLLARVSEIQRQQMAVANAVLDLAQQMARITFIDDVPTDDDDYERRPPYVPPSHRRTESRPNGDGRVRRQ
jgi:ribosomal protein L29